MDSTSEIKKLEIRLERERLRRSQAEFIAETSLRDLYDRLSRLELLWHIATASNEMQSVQQVLEFAVHQFAKFGSWRLGHAFVNSENVLRPSGAWYYLDEMRTTIFRTVTRNLEFKPGQGLPGMVLETRKPIWLPDLEAEKNFPRLRFAQRSGLKSGVGFPILRRNEVVAVVELYDTAYRQRDPALLELLAQGGEQLGLAIDRQNAKERLEKQTVELAAARDEARAADKAKSVFLASTSHELRTPLNAIIGFSDLMLGGIGGALSEKHVEYIRDIRTSGIHLKEIINNILDLSKIDAGALQMHCHATSIPEVCETCRRMVAPIAQASGVNLSYAVSPSLPLFNLDSVRFKQALLNVTSNAVKFTNRGGEVLIFTELSDDECVVGIKDNGIGMSPEEVALALLPFRQVDGRLNRRYEGTGLGLPLAKALIELQGGRLSISSAPGEGTTAKFHVPRNLEAVAA